MTSAATRLRQQLDQDGLTLAPGAYDCITARMIKHAGFSAIYMTGAGTSASLGYPDYGLVTMSEMADNAGRIANAVDIPVIADADTGYGNELNTVRTVQEYERRGVAGLHIEDQEIPKKCGHLEDKVLVPLDDYLAKIRAAAAARKNPDFLIIARTDSRAVYGFEEAIRRVNAALAAGADMAFVEAPQTMEEVAAVPKLVRGPCLLNMVWRGKTPLSPVKDVEAMGYKLAIMPSLLFRSVLGMCETVLGELRQTGVHPELKTNFSVSEGFRRMGGDFWDPLRTQFRVPQEEDGEKAAAE
ncbi:carboxyvinyl-carboxyphosphonate phosphorylmutase [Allostella vacuolata]|nr:carboxyvinyl-carboxyphosphonate phosphorylmutase [Stella vacuolata]